MTVAVIGAQAQTKMVIHQKVGEDVEILLSSKPVVTYEESNLVVKSSSATLSYPLSALEKITYSNVATAVEEMAVLNKDAGPSQVYDLNGRLFMTVPANQPVETSALPRGMYIIKSNNISYKIQK